MAGEPTPVTVPVIRCGTCRTEWLVVINLTAAECLYDDGEWAVIRKGE